MIDSLTILVLISAGLSALSRARKQRFWQAFSCAMFIGAVDKIFYLHQKLGHFFAFSYGGRSSPAAGEIEGHLTVKTIQHALLLIGAGILLATLFYFRSSTKTERYSFQVFFCASVLFLISTLAETLAPWVDLVSGFDAVLPILKLFAAVLFLLGSLLELMKSEQKQTKINRS